MLANVFKKKKTLLMLTMALKLSCNKTADAPNSSSKLSAGSTVRNESRASAANNSKALNLADGCFTDFSGKVSPIKYQQLPNVPYGLTTTGIVIPNVNISNKCSAGLNLTEDVTPGIFQMLYSLKAEEGGIDYQGKFEDFLNTKDTDGNSLRSKLSNLNVEGSTFSGISLILLNPKTSLFNVISFAQDQSESCTDSENYMGSWERPSIDGISVNICKDSDVNSNSEKLNLLFSRIVSNMITGQRLFEGQKDLSVLSTTDLKAIFKESIKAYVRNDDLPPRQYPPPPTVFEGTPQKEKVDYALLIDSTIIDYKDKFEGFLDDATNGESLRSKLSNLNIQAPVGGVLLTFTGILDPSSDRTARTEDAIIFMDPAQNGTQEYNCGEKYFIAKTGRPFNSDDIDGIQTIVCTSNPETDAALRLTFSEIVFNMLTGTSLAEQQDLSALSIADLKTLLEPYISKYDVSTPPTVVTIDNSSPTDDSGLTADSGLTDDSGLTNGREHTPLTLKTVNTSNIPLTFTPAPTGANIPTVCVDIYEGLDNTNLLSSFKIQSQTLFLNPSWSGKTLFMEYGICAPMSSSSSTHTLGELFISYLYGPFDTFGSYDYITKKILTFQYEAPAADTAENSAANTNFKTQSTDGTKKGLMLQTMNYSLERLYFIKDFKITEPILSWFKNENLTYLKVPINDTQTYNPIENYISILLPKFNAEKKRLCNLNTNAIWQDSRHSCNWSNPYLKSQCDNVQGTLDPKTGYFCLISTEATCTKLGYTWSDGKCVKGSSFTASTDYFGGNYLVSPTDASTGTASATPLPVENSLSELEASSPSTLEMQQTLAQITGQNSAAVNQDVLAAILGSGTGANLNLTVGPFRNLFTEVKVKVKNRFNKLSEDFNINARATERVRLGKQLEKTPKDLNIKKQYDDLKVIDSDFSKKFIARERRNFAAAITTLTIIGIAAFTIMGLSINGDLSTSNSHSSGPNSAVMADPAAILCNYRNTLVRLTTEESADSDSYNKCLTETAALVGVGSN